MSSETIRFGEVDLTTCDREPIHIPGSIQPHGVLLVTDRRTLSVEQVAGDSKLLLGIEPHHAVQRSVPTLLDSEAEAFVREKLGASARIVAPITRLGVQSRSGSLPLDLTLHAQEQTAILELEPARRTMTSAGDPIAQLKTLLAAVQVTASVDASCATAATALRVATGFDRAMVYRFLPDLSGMIVAEDARPGLESFLGLHYPASDIPRQARELYRRNWLRTITDVNYKPAPLIPPVNPRTGQPIDMSHCTLRSVSPIHVEYLQNMGVSASLSASIVCQDALWGMLVLHHYAPRHVSADLRIACETFAQIFSLHVEAKSQAETSVQRLDARRAREELLDSLTDTRDIGGAIAAWDPRRYLNAAGAVVYLEGRLHLVGETPAAADIDALVHWLNGINRPLFATENLSSQFAPAAKFPGVASGLVAVGLSREPRDYVLWFRPEMGRTVRWAGDPSKSVKVGPLGARLTPRGSFAEWLEETRMQSAPWSEIDLEAAEALRVVLLECVLRSVDLARREQAFAETRAIAEQLELRVAQRTAQLHALSSDLEAAEERERRQIARDLHDDLGQILAAARIRLAGLCGHEQNDVRAKANEVGALIDRASDSTRSLAAQLAPAVLHELGLYPALEWLGEEIERTFKLKVTTIDDGRPKPLTSEIRSILYRAVRELLINVAKHAHTDSALVEMEQDNAKILVRVSDAGVGYDPSAIVAVPRAGLGLITVRERLSLIGGAAEIRSIPGTGTVALLSAPLAPSAAASARDAS
jgi:light-regulated signal transduction histidine kinase (bacteriophytochrome)/two-component sensor histidine kinase